MKLQTGEYFGSLLHKRELPIAVLTETEYQPHSELPEHSHRNGYICFALSGKYNEIWGETHCKVNSGTLLFHPSESHHANQFLDVPARCFNIELLPESHELLEIDSKDLGNEPQRYSGEVTLLARKLYREFTHPDHFSHLAIDALIIELFISITRANRDLAQTSPEWLNRAVNYLQSHFHEAQRIDEVAIKLGLGSVELARAFREHLNCSFYEYLGRIRIDYVCRELIEDNTPIGHIAVSAGFYDQSHLTRTFKRSIGMTPLEFRRKVQSN